MKTDCLDIYVSQRQVGTLSRNVDGGFDFIYLPTATQDDAISLTMPVEEDYRDFMILPPALQISLPEGYLLETIYRYLGKSLKINDDFDILSLVGNNLVGRINACRAGDVLQPKTWIPSIDALMRSPSSKIEIGKLIEKTAIGTGLSGVIPKALASWEGHTALICANSILKTDTEEYPGLCIIESLSMQMCREAGMMVPDTHLAEDGQSIAIDRFDLNVDGTALAFEDFCSLSGRGRTGKYSGSYEGIAWLLSANSSYPSEDLRAFYQMMFMNTVLRNGDAHLKNFGVLYTSRDDVRLAPVYDVMCTQTFIPEDLPALPTRTDEAIQWPTHEELRAFGRDTCGLNEPDMDRIHETTLAGIQSVMNTQLPDAERRYHGSRIGSAIQRFKAIIQQSVDQMILAGQKNKDAQSDESLLAGPR